MNYGIKGFTGVRPTADLTIANYMGAVKPMLEYFPGESIVFVAELHAMTTNSPEEVKNNSIELVRTMIAAGFEGSVYSQLDVRSLVFDAQFIVNGVVSTNELMRLPTLKDKFRDHDDTGRANARLMLYPSLMSADIVLARPENVPTGKDQAPHLELTNKIIRRINKDRGTELPEPKQSPAEPVNVMSLTNPRKKMSKSGPANGAIYMDDSPNSGAKKIKKALSANETGPELSAVVDNLVLIASGLTNDPIQMEAIRDIAKRTAKGEKNMGDLKSEVGGVVHDFLKDMHLRKLCIDETEVKQRIAIGNESFTEIATATLEHINFL